MKISLSGRTAVITGASRGLGEAMAKALSGAGAQIALVARDRDRMERVRSDIAGTQQTAEVFVADLTQEDQVARLA
ncbi:MAG TPA: SDR family NAD(P)-dependent oxidoreductase, partial [Terracidiphilus sp.]|nr:SDR family NAD(P)-dependent oxidoreductase [Terracidiphilus sp.]